METMYASLSKHPLLHFLPFLLSFTEKVEMKFSCFLWAAAAAAAVSNQR